MYTKLDSIDMTSPNFRLSIGCLCLLVFAAFMIAGCAENYVRVTEYEGAALPIPGVNAAAGGCAVNAEGEIPGRLIYRGKTCVYDSNPDQNDNEIKIL